MLPRDCWANEPSPHYYLWKFYFLLVSKNELSNDDLKQDDMYNYFIVWWLKFGNFRKRIPSVRVCLLMTAWVPATTPPPVIFGPTTWLPAGATSKHDEVDPQGIIISYRGSKIVRPLQHLKVRSAREWFGMWFDWTVLCLESLEQSSILPLVEMFHPTGERSVLQGVPAMFGPHLVGDFTVRSVLEYQNTRLFI